MSKFNRGDRVYIISKTKNERIYAYSTPARIEQVLPRTFWGKHRYIIRRIDWLIENDDKEKYTQEDISRAFVEDEKNIVKRTRKL